MVKIWNIAISSPNFDEEGIITKRVSGTKENVKAYFCNLIHEAKIDDLKHWYFGTECPDEVKELEDGSLYASATFADYSYDYLATIAPTGDDEAIDISHVFVLSQEGKENEKNN